MARIPINLASGSIQEENIIVGIDLGTTHSLVARTVDGVPAVVADIGRGPLVPSVVHFGPGGSKQVGEDALPYLLTDPAHTVYSVKRLMGCSYPEVAAEQAHFAYPLAASPDGRQVQIEALGASYSPIEVSSFILQELKARAEHRLKQPVQRAVVTVPAYFNDAQRQATRDAGRLAGLDILRIVNEPTAAALAYGLGLDPAERKTCVVYDFGGGTFDVTVLRIEQGLFEVLATHGDTYLGGDDADQLLAHYFQQELQAQLPLATSTGALRLVAKQVKEALSTASAFDEELEIGGAKARVTLTRGKLEELLLPLVERTLASCRAALNDAKLTPQAMDAVVLVGGSTRIPLVKKKLAELFGQQPYDGLNPDEVVALGAAVQADILAGNRKDLLLLDVTPLSLGIETLGGLMDVLIPRNTKIPARYARQYTTSVDGQVNLKVAVYQGERDLVADNRKLAEFELRGIPPMPATLPKVELSFLLDADGILRVEAKELRSGVAQHIEVRPQAGLTDAEVEAMLLAAMSNAPADIALRARQEAVQEGKQLIYQTEKFLANHRARFSPEEAEGLAALLGALRAATEAADKEAINGATTALDAFSRPLAERVMDAAVQAALQGRDVAKDI